MGNSQSENKIYEDFEPYWRWITREQQVSVDIKLKGFKKEQLQVQVENSKNVLAISGERTLDASKPTHFRKEFDLPKGCAADEILAKFSQKKGILSIVMPKTVIPKEPEEPFTKEPEDKIRDVATTSSGPEDKIRDVAITSSEAEDNGSWLYSLLLKELKWAQDVAITSSEPEDKIRDVAIT
ncbi:hypothetical protein L6164_006308 [Bauhinia variegata]|uniref:Uncharacterized protein n=1 Tax=Bauhinia variegata TaxID=167791 RepID=A0ACB9PTI8_BAUVA|nr:hypothetical protein L6164_006308 [Bauhinia variegata]